MPAVACFAALLAVQATIPRRSDVVQSIDAIAASLAGRFRDPAGFQQAASGQYYVFDRAAHAVYGIDRDQTKVWEIVRIGPEVGRIIDPSAFSLEPNGSFAVADAPNGRERVHMFTPMGYSLGGFMLPSRSTPRVVLGGVALNGIGSLQYTGTSVLLSEPFVVGE